MKQLISRLKIEVNPLVYLKNPDSSDLGKRILSGSIDMIEDMGFESFTFKKLSENIKTTEASVYRYFESKHKLLLYLSCWYWGWLEYRLVFGIANIKDPRERLYRAVEIITNQLDEDFEHPFIDLKKLSSIIVSESAKTYLTREVDQENKAGAFEGYKNLIDRVSKIIEEINPDYPYSHMLVSTIIEGSHHQKFFSAHLPGLTDKLNEKNSISEFYKDLSIKSILVNSQI
jgi:hypothetical protein